MSSFSGDDLSFPVVVNSFLADSVKMYVEDKNSHQGPIAFTVTASMTVGELRKKVSLRL